MWRKLSIALLALLVIGLGLGLGLAVAALAASPSPHGEGPVTVIPRGLLGPRGIGGLKAAIATAGAVLLGLGLVLERRGRGDAWRRSRDAALAVLGVVGAACWWNLFQFNFPDHAHPSDSFHYYLGAKYFPELGYTRLYRCVLVADAETDAPEWVLARRIRDLESNELVPAEAVLAEPERCKRHFSAERWKAFRRDTRWFRNHVAARRWVRFQQDHGYNATPAWGILGRAVASTGPVSAAQLRWIRLLDPALLLAMWGAVVWAFGWRVACAAAIYWGTNYPAPFGWTGGSILRQDWLAATITGICLLRRGAPAAAGALVGWAAFLRIFPGLVAVGVGLQALAQMAVARRVGLARAPRRFVVGGLAAAALVVPLSALSSGGLDAWMGFAENSRVHLATPLANHLGLRTVLSHDPEQRTAVARDPSLDDPMARWKQARRDTFAGRALLFWTLVAGFAALVARATLRREPWVAAVLGVALIPIATELTGYYHAVLLAFALLARGWPMMGALTCAFSALGWLIGDRWHWTDEIHVWISVLTVGFCVFAVLLVTHREPVAEPGALDRV